MNVTSVNSIPPTCQTPRAQTGVQNAGTAIKTDNGPDTDSAEISRLSALRAEVSKHNNDFHCLYSRHLVNDYFLGDQLTPEDIKQEFLDWLEKNQAFGDTVYSEYISLEDGPVIPFRNMEMTDAEYLTHFYVQFRNTLFADAAGATVFEGELQAEAAGEHLAFAYNADHYYKAHEAMALIDEAMAELGASGRYAGARIMEPEEAPGASLYKGYNYTLQSPSLPYSYMNDLEQAPPRGFKLYFADRKYTAVAEQEGEEYALAFQNANQDGGFTHYIKIPKGMNLFQTGKEISMFENYRLPNPTYLPHESRHLLYDLTGLINPRPGQNVLQDAEAFIRERLTNIYAGTLRVTTGGESFTADVPFWLWNEDSTRLKFNASEIIQQKGASDSFLSNFNLYHGYYETYYRNDD